MISSRGRHREGRRAAAGGMRLDILTGEAMRTRLPLPSWALSPAWPTVPGAADPPLARHPYTEPHMGTRFQITLYAPDESTAGAAARAAFARIATLDGIMSDYRATSELMQ